MYRTGLLCILHVDYSILQADEECALPSYVPTAHIMVEVEFNKTLSMVLLIIFLNACCSQLSTHF